MSVASIFSLGPDVSKAHSLFFSVEEVIGACGDWYLGFQASCESILPSNSIYHTEVTGFVP